jgi:hypothetical protein
VWQVVKNIREIRGLVTMTAASKISNVYQGVVQDIAKFPLLLWTWDA